MGRYSLAQRVKYRLSQNPKPCSELPDSNGKQKQLHCEANQPAAKPVITSPPPVQKHSVPIQKKTPEGGEATGEEQRVLRMGNAPSTEEVVGDSGAATTPQVRAVMLPPAGRETQTQRQRTSLNSGAGDTEPGRAQRWRRLCGRAAQPRGRRGALRPRRPRAPNLPLQAGGGTQLYKHLRGSGAGSWELVSSAAVLDLYDANEDAAAKPPEWHLEIEGAQDPVVTLVDDMFQFEPASLRVTFNTPDATCWSLKFGGARAFESFLQRYNKALFENQTGLQASEASQHKVRPPARPPAATSQPRAVVALLAAAGRRLLLAGRRGGSGGEEGPRKEGKRGGHSANALETNKNNSWTDIRLSCLPAASGCRSWATSSTTWDPRTTSPAPTGWSIWMW